MKFFTSLLFLYMSLFAAAQPAIQWQHCYGGTKDEIARSIIQTSDGGYAMAGLAYSNDSDVSAHHGSITLSDYWVVKTDSLGNVQWSHSYGGNQQDEARCIIQTEDKGFAVAGFSKSNNGDITGHHSDADMWIIKTDSAGTLQWQKSLGGSGEDIAYSIVETEDHGYVIAGSARSPDGDVGVNLGWADVWIVKIDSAANIVWKLDCGGSQEDIAYAVSETADNGFIIAGSSRSDDDNVGRNFGDADDWVIKLNSGGGVEWGRVFGGTEEDAAYAVAQTEDGGYIVSGTSNSVNVNVSGNHQSFDNWIVKLDNTGSVLWEHCFGGTGYEGGQSVARTADGGIIALGMAYSDDGDVTGSHAQGDYWLLKLNGSGIMEWQKCLGGSQNDAGYSVIQTSDLGFAVSGGSSSYDGDVTGNHDTTTNDFWTVKLAAYRVGISEPEAPEGISIYPNPSTGKFTVYDGHASLESIEVYNATGNLVFSDQSCRGMHKHNLIITEANGIYIVKMREENAVTVKKLIVE